MKEKNKTDQWLTEKRHRASERRRLRTIEKRKRQKDNGIECPDCGGTMPWKVIKIFAKYGWMSGGAIWNLDAQHFQATNW